MKKIELIHPVTTIDGEYGRGVHELEDATADVILKGAPDVAKLFTGREPVTGTVTKPGDAPGPGQPIDTKRKK